MSIESDSRFFESCGYIVIVIKLVCLLSLCLMYSMDLSLIVDLPQNQRLSSQSRSLSRRRLNRPRRYRVPQPQRRNLKEVGSNRTLIISFRHSTREKNVSLKLSRIGFFITCSAAKWRLGSCIHVISFFFLVFVSYAGWMSQIYIFQFLAYLFLYKHCQNISLNIPVHVYMFRTLFSIKAWLSFPFLLLMWIIFSVLSAWHSFSLMYQWMNISCSFQYRGVRRRITHTTQTKTPRWLVLILLHCIQFGFGVIITRHISHCHIQTYSFTHW